MTLRDEGRARVAAERRQRMETTITPSRYNMANVESTRCERRGIETAVQITTTPMLMTYSAMPTSYQYMPLFNRLQNCIDIKNSLV